MVTKGNVKKLYELSLLLTTLGLAPLAVSEAETPTYGAFLTLFLFVTHRKNAD